MLQFTNFADYCIYYKINDLNSLWSTSIAKCYYRYFEFSRQMLQSRFTWRCNYRFV